MNSDPYSLAELACGAAGEIDFHILGNQIPKVLRGSVAGLVGILREYEVTEGSDWMDLLCGNFPYRALVRTLDAQGDRPKINRVHELASGMSSLVADLERATTLEPERAAKLRGTCVELSRQFSYESDRYLSRVA